jgi:hydroxymethylpyrimidine/phosphomethylpyrimidine kinase
MQTALTIAGSDSSGGAGLQADLKTFAAHGVFGLTAVTAITAQNTRGVTAVHVIPPDLVVAQIHAVQSDLGADAIKIGMLGTAAIAEAVADAIARLDLRNVVLDTVLVAKSGALLLDAAGIDVMRRRLLPLALVATPNAPEAAALTGLPVETREDQRRAAIRLVELGARAAIVKGGHLHGPAVDVLFDGTRVVELTAERVATRHTHGTGCTFSSAIAARLALGDRLIAAAESAKRYVTQAIQHAPGLGHGHGPLQHFFQRFVP